MKLVYLLIKKKGYKTGWWSKKRKK